MNKNNNNRTKKYINAPLLILSDFCIARNEKPSDLEAWFCKNGEKMKVGRHKSGLIIETGTVFIFVLIVSIVYVVLHKKE